MYGIHFLAIEIMMANYNMWENLRHIGHVVLPNMAVTPLIYPIMEQLNHPQMSIVGLPPSAVKKNNINKITIL